MSQAIRLMVRGLSALAAGCLLASSGCKRQSDAPPPPPPPEVEIITAQAGTVPITYDYVGQTEASKQVEVRARVAGFILRRPFEEGKPIDEGDLLFEIDKRQYEADLMIARARQAEAEARLKLAEVTLNRVKSAMAQGGTTQQELDEKSAQVQEAEAQLNLAKGNVANANLNLSYCTVLSPLRGRVSKSPVYEGQYVDGGPNSLLATVVQSDPIYVDVNISEREVLKWQSDIASGRITLPKGGEDGMRVALTLIDNTAFPTEGKFNFIDVRVDPLTGTANVRAEFPNPDEKLRPGQFVKARFVGAQRASTITVPQRAIISQPTGQYVMLVGEGDKAELRLVKLSEWTEDDWIVDEGLKAGDRVIVNGLLGVAPNSPVRIKQAAPATK
jgi:membrane fusion protein (multidrug efflux system)